MKKINTLVSKVLNFSLVKAKQSVSVTIVSLLLVSTTTFATPISNLFVFGDSLSDPGALNSLAPAACRPAPYADCRFTNGPVWAELVAAELGVSGNSAYAGGTNYAIGGQTSSSLLFDPVFGGQLPAFNSITGGVADPDALFVIWAGGNDLLQGLDPLAAVDNIITTILALQVAGANDFLIPNLPVANLWAVTFNAALASGLNNLGGGLNITQLDVFGKFFEISMNPAEFGFTNISDPCFDISDPANPTLCADPDEYLFWDTVHPTAAGHRLIAAAALSALQVQVSAPTTVAILSLGLVVLVSTRRKM